MEYVTLEEIKAWCLISPTDTSKDDLLNMMIVQACDAVDLQCGWDERMFYKEIEEVLKPQKAGSKIFISSFPISLFVPTDFDVVDAETLAIASKQGVRIEKRNGYFISNIWPSFGYALSVKYKTGLFEAVPPLLKNVCLNIAKQGFDAIIASQTPTAQQTPIAAPLIIKSKKVGNMSVTYETSADAITAASTATTFAFDIFGNKNVDAVLEKYKKKKALSIKMI